MTTSYFGTTELPSLPWTNGATHVYLTTEVRPHKLDVVAPLAHEMVARMVARAVAGKGHKRAGAAGWLRMTACGASGGGKHDAPRTAKAMVVPCAGLGSSAEEGVESEAARVRRARKRRRELGESKEAFERFVDELFSDDV